MVILRGGFYSKRLAIDLENLCCKNSLFCALSQHGGIVQGKLPGTKKTPTIAFPEIEGSETAAELIGKYKKGCLSRKQVHRDLLEKIETEKPITGKNLIFALLVSLFLNAFVWAVSKI